MGLLSRGHRAEHDRLARQHAQERALAGAQVARGAGEPGEGWAVATPHRLVLAFGEDVVVRRWCDVDHGALDAQSAQLTITWVDGAPETVIRQIPIAISSFRIISAIAGYPVSCPVSLYGCGR